MVGLQTLNLPILVRAQASEPNKKAAKCGFFIWLRKSYLEKHSC